MINTKPLCDKTETGRKLTVEDIQTIANARIGAGQEVESLLEIIDRLTGTCWTRNG